MQPLRFLHIPKTAGTTFTDILNQQYCDGVKFQLTGDIRSDINRFEQLSEQQQKAIVLYTGHAPIRTGVRTIDDIDVVTFLRDPVSRVKSFCQHVSEGKSPYLLKKFPPESFDLQKFLNARIFELNNLQTKMLVNQGASAVDFNMSNDEALQLATDHLFNTVKAFGLVEYFDESLIVFKQKFAWKLPVYQRRNSKNINKLITFEPHHIDQIKSLNALDIELYDRAKEHFLLLLNAADFDTNQLKNLKNKNSKQHVNLAHLKHQVKNIIDKLYQRFMG